MIRIDNPLTIRPATMEDHAAIRALYRDLHPEDPALSEKRSIEALENILAHPGLTLLLGELDGQPVTTCTLVVIPNYTRRGAPYALIENVVTLQRQRGQGYGQAVLQAAFECAWKAGCYKIMLLTGSKRPSTLAFYEKAGFERSKTGFHIRAPGHRS